MRTAISAPLDLGDIVSTAWTLCLRHWRPLLAMGGVSGAGGLALNLGLFAAFGRVQPANGPATAPPPFALAWLAVLGLPLVLFNQLALIRFSLEFWATGTVRVKGCYARAALVFRPFLMAALTVGVVFALCVFTTILLPVAVYLLVCWFFVGQIYAAEARLRPLQALVRSRALVRGLWWRTAGVLLGLTLLSLLPSLAAEVIPSRTLAGSLLLSGLTTAVAAPFAAASQSLLYLDLRLRKHERIDLAPSGPAESV